MEYSTKEVRRQDRVLKKEESASILVAGMYGVLSLRDNESGAYGLPISYAWDGENNIYFHCAKEGKKLQLIEKYNRVSFCVVGEVVTIEEKFSTTYESVIIQGKAHIGLSPEEKIKALMLLVKKYSPDYIEKGEKYAQGAFNETEVIRFEIISWSGKSRK